MEKAGPAARTAARPVPAPVAVSPAVDLFGLAQMLFRRKWLVIGTAALVILAAFAALTLIGPRYKATARILVDPREVRVVENEMVQRGLGNDPMLVESQVEVITSEAVLMRVVRSEKLGEDAEFVQPAGGASSRSADEIALESLAEATKVSRADNTYVIEIAVTTREPAKSARLANAIAAAYTQDQQDTTASATRNVSDSIGDRLAELQKKLREDEQKVEDYKTANNLSNPDGRSLVDNRLNDLSTRLSAAVGRTAEAKSRLEVIEQAMKQRGDVSSVVSDTENTTMVQLRNQLSDAQAALAQLRQTLGPRHPRAAAAQAQVDQAERAIRAESERLVAATRDAYRAAQETEQAIARSLKELTGQSFETNQRMIQLRELERQAQASRTVYEAFLVRAKEATEQENLGAKSARIIAPAAVPDSPSFPPRSLLLAASLVFGIGLGVFNAIVAEMLFGTPAAVSRRTAAGTAPGIVPAGATFGGPAAILRDRVVLTLSLSDVGRSREAGLELARDASRDGFKTLFADLSAEGGEPGLAELSRGTAGVSDVLSRDAVSSVHMLHGGNAETGVSGDEFRRTFGVFLDTYDRIVINVGLLAGAANEMVADVIAAADHAVLVVASDELSAEEASAFQELAAGGGMSVSALALADEHLERAA